MEDKYFWENLEFRMSHEFAKGFRDDWKHIWIDGFIPNSSTDRKSDKVIAGRVWIVFDQKQEQWDFSLTVPQDMLHDQINEFGYQLESFNAEKGVLALSITKVDTQPCNPGGRLRRR